MTSGRDFTDQVRTALELAVPSPHLFIGGATRPASNGATFAVLNPADGSVVAEVPDATDDDMRAAIAAASAALPVWRDLPAVQRARVLRRAADLLRERVDSVAVILTAEQGKPLSESRGEVEYAAGFFEWFAGEAERVYGQVVPAQRPGHRVLVFKQPVGVTAAITPWNFPAAMLARKLGPALAAGCTSVCKPASATPLTAMAVCQVLIDAGVPAGAVNLFTTRRSSVAADILLSDSRIRKLSFTGSTDVGQELVRRSAKVLTRLSLELGGHAPYLIFADADLDIAVAGLMASKFRNAGQTCISVNRVYVQREIADEVVARLGAAMSKLVVGDGMVPGTTIGPLIDAGAVAKVSEHVSDALRQGAKLGFGGKARPDLGPTYYEPTIVTGVQPEMLVSSEETFGPLVAVSTFDTEEQAIELANNSPYGLAAYFCTSDYARMMRLAERLEYGVIGANDGMPSTPAAPFGGMKMSGYGREGGSFGIEEYLDVKYLSIGGIGPSA